MLKKILFLMMAVMLIGIPAYPQDSNPVELTMSAFLEYGIVLTVTGNAFTWASIAMPTNGSQFIESDTGPIPVTVYARLATAAHRGELILTTNSVERDGVSIPTWPIHTMVKFIFIGDIAKEVFANSIGAFRLIWTSTESSFSKSTTMSAFFSNSLVNIPGVYTASFTLMMLDKVV